MGRGFVIWFLCLGALLVGFLGAQVNPLAFLLVGVLAPLPVLVTGWRSGELAAGALALAAVAAIFCLHPGLETIWQNLGFLNLLLMGVMLASLQCRGVAAPQAIMVTVAALTVGALLVFLGQSVFMGISPQDLLAQKSAEIMDTVRKVMGDAAAAGPGGLVPGVAPAQMEALLQHLLPGLLVTNLALVAWLNVVLSRQMIFAPGMGRSRSAAVLLGGPGVADFCGAGGRRSPAGAGERGAVLWPQSAHGGGGDLFLPGSGGGGHLVSSAGAAAPAADDRLPFAVFEPVFFLDYHLGVDGPVAGFSPVASAQRCLRRSFP